MQHVVESVSQKIQIHPTAVIHGDLKCEEGVIIGPYAIIDGPVFIGAGTRIDAHATIRGPISLGKHNHIGSYAYIGCDSQDRKYEGGEARLEIGDHNIFREYVTVSRGNHEQTTRIGSHNLLMAYVHIGHDCQIGDFNRFSNNVALAGHVEIEHHIVFGGLTGVHQFVKIGAYAFTGGGSLISKDVPPFVMVGSEPTRLAGLNLVGLERNGFTQEQRFILRKYYRKLFQESLSIRETAQDCLAGLSENEFFVKPLFDFILSSERGIIR